MKLKTLRGDMLNVRANGQILYNDRSLGLETPISDTTLHIFQDIDTVIIKYQDAPEFDKRIIRFWEYAKRKYLLGPKFGFKDFGQFPRLIKNEKFTFGLQLESQTELSKIDVVIKNGVMLPVIQKGNFPRGIIITQEGTILNIFKNKAFPKNITLDYEFWTYPKIPRKIIRYAYHYMQRSSEVDLHLKRMWEAILFQWKKFGFEPSHL
ncbi:MAG: hypothetical protein KC713_02425 [Candidatus Omnitrophica bacterium]|nr:hypothetical protein [Candidatus Omnitrophota bacterium]